MIAAIGEPEWKDICPWDDGTELAAFQRETLDPRIWGGAVQIAAMARIRRVAILVHTDFGLQVFLARAGMATQTPWQPWAL